MLVSALAQVKEGAKPTRMGMVLRYDLTGHSRILAWPRDATLFSESRCFSWSIHPQPIKTDNSFCKWRGSSVSLSVWWQYKMFYYVMATTAVISRYVMYHKFAPDTSYCGFDSHFPPLNFLGVSVPYTCSWVPQKPKCLRSASLRAFLQLRHVVSAITGSCILILKLSFNLTPEYIMKTLVHMALEREGEA